MSSSRVGLFPEQGVILPIFVTPSNLLYSSISIFPNDLKSESTASWRGRLPKGLKSQKLPTLNTVVLDSPTPKSASAGRSPCNNFL